MQNFAAAGGILSGVSLGGFGEICNNNDVTGIMSGIGGSALKQASSSLDGAFKSLKDSCHAAFDFIKFDVFTNFFQQIGLWLNNMGFPQFFEKCFQKIMSFVSLLWNFVMSITELQMFYIWGSLSTLIFTIWLVQKIFDPEVEIKGPNTFGWQERGTIWNLITRGIVTLLTFLYLPAMTSAFNVLLCSKKLLTQYEMTCYEGIHWAHMAAAFFLFIYIGIVFPGVIYQVINKYQPEPQQYDENGDRIEYDREKFLLQYRMLLSKGKCPYNFLYSGYEYGRSIYKVTTLVVKMLLVIPVNPLISSGIASVSMSLVIVFIYATMSTLMKPFILDQDDYIDITARVTAVLTLIIQILILCKVLSDQISGILLVTINIINLVVMVLIFLGNVDFIKNFFRRHFGSLQFTNKMTYDYIQDRKRRIWQRFWRGLLSSYGTLIPAYERLCQMEDVVMTEGRTQYKEGLNPSNDDIKQARRLCRELEGTDIYYRCQKPLKSYWGRMYIQPFPFRAVIVYDYENHRETIGDEQILTFINQNKAPEIVKARKLRQALRCLDGEDVNFEYFEDNVLVKHGPCGHERARVCYKRGTLRVKSNANDMFCEGYKLRIYYTDGYGEFSDGSSFSNHKKKIGHEELGVNIETFELSDQLKALITEPSNLATIRTKWDDYLERCSFYRHDLEEEREEEEQQASWSFWYMVFDNDFIPFEQLSDYIHKFETNPELKTALTLYRTEFDAVYSRLKYYDSHPAIAYWYCFWDDLAVKNTILKKIEAHPELFSLSDPNALIYHPTPMDELKRKLENAGLRTRGGNGLFNNKILNQLYSNLNDKGLTDRICYNAKNYYVMPPQGINTFDPRCVTTPLITENTTFIASAATCLF
ncbi:hypothetical protein M9Y10_043350 [Tritrichomonas musculus]|uniref:Uncharacterized protein n=1 Tax=Tritrichomonas musculus TaxID=1915356 RepID=A0ABR2JZF5_9EUKA